MDEDYGSIARAQQSRSGRTRAMLGTGAVVVAVALVGLVWWSGWQPSDLFAVKREQQPALSAPLPTPSASASEATAAQARQAVAQVQQVVQQQGGLDSRVAAMEQRLAKLDLQLQAASGNAARTEGLLVAFAARRAVERGAPLGYLADQLQLRFGDAHPRSVRTIVDFSHDPVTLDQLVARLQGLEPELVKAPKDEGAISWLGREISGLFVIRRASTPSPEPQRRIDRAQLFLESGRIDPAIAEVKNLPNAQEAADWIADAERYAAARQALDMLETTAILEPRELRNGAGQRIEQPSPVVSAP
jgi:hypothetical protein|uniref:MICOS complex subunit MIC60 n=1 Tax=Altererythrobacter segetis TaxID=1104773 RepID=UPI001FAFD3F5|nr:MICOS complex subunit MIC60 [Altererythrobacter segetis]